ncbi:MAG: T9SS type A sorting domain-containing protein, partial [Bacteroidia bacterium]
MAKYTVNGTLIYGSSIGGSGSDAGYRIKVSTNGDFYINGIFNSPGADVDPSISATTTLQCTGSGDNLFIGKYSGSNGDLIWAGEAGCSGDIQPFSIQEDFNGDIFICGKYNNVTDFDFSTSGIFTLTPLTSSSNSDIFISKYAGNGDFMYAGTIGGGTTNDNEGIYVHSIGGSSFILTGVFGESIDMDPSTATSSSLTANGGSDIFLAKYTICTEPGFATIIPSSSTVCANNTVSLTVGSGTLGSASNWVWYNGSCGTSSVGTGTLISVSPSVSTTYYVRGEGGCVTPTTCTSDMITVIPSKDIVGNVTSAVSSTLQGNVVLFEFQNQLAKWDSITSSSINGTGQFSLNAITSTSYILQFIPDNNSHQVSYAPNAVAWKDASVFSHGCLLNTTKDVTVAAFPTFTPGPGIISGKIVEGQGYGQKGTQITVPGNPIGGLNIKVGKNPGGNYQAQSRSDGAGGYTISGLPINQVGENYFIYVDIPGIDTSGTYYVTITGTNAVFNNLDFIADSDYVYNAFFLSIDELNQKKAEVFVYPNPANEQISIDLFGLKENSAKITLHSLTGKLVFEKKVDYDKSDPKAIINTKDFENGVYLFGLEVEGVLRQRKLIIRH